MRRAALLAALLLTLLVPALAAAQGTPATPIPDATEGGAPAFVGEPVDEPAGIWAPAPPQHPFLAPDPGNNVHNDAYMSDVYRGPGPLGRDMAVSSTSQFGECGTVTFDRDGNLVSVCVTLTGPVLKKFHPRTLATLASRTLPPRQLDASVAGALTDVSGGGYFYLDRDDRAVIPTTTRHLWVVDRGFNVVHDVDLSGLLEDGDKLFSALPDWKGNVYVVSQRGAVIVVPPSFKGEPRVHRLGEPINNSLATDDSGGVYIVTERALYRFDTTADGAPAITWREPYEAIDAIKPGQFDRGSGTTPTLLGDDLVAITDNADPMNVVVYRRDRAAPAGGSSRRICRAPVFERGASATENSLIGFNESLIVANNYGYTGPARFQGGAQSSPGIARVDLDDDRDGCRLAWTATDVRAPSSVNKLSLATGLVYAVTKPEGRADPYYLSALDVRTGRLHWSKLYGTGFGHNNNYAPVTLGPDGTAYVGVIGGLVRLADATPPRATVPPPPTPALRLSLRARRGRAVAARLSGPDARLVRRVDFRAGRRTLFDEQPPFARYLRLSGSRRGQRVRITARATLRDGRTRTLRRSVRLR